MQKKITTFYPLLLCLLIITAIGCNKSEPCDDVTCFNNGQCLEGTCICPDGFEGEFCQTASDPCEDLPCLNNGQCVEGICVCPTGFTGVLCEIAIEACESITCQNNGYCENGACVCPTGYSGQFCETLLQPTQMILQVVTLTSWPGEHDGNDWDPFGGKPDFYVRILSGGEEVFKSDRVDHCETGVEYDYNCNFTMDMNSQYALEVRDFDTTSADDLAASINFTPSGYYSDLPIVVFLSESSTNLTLAVAWEY